MFITLGTIILSAYLSTLVNRKFADVPPKAVRVKYKPSERKN